MYVVMKQERQPYTELDPHLISAYAATFVPRTDVFPIQLPNGKYASVKKNLTTNLIAAHLTGGLTIGAYALDEQSHAKWICLDADTQELWTGLTELAGDLQTKEIPAYLEPSRRGGHLWLFTQSISGSEARQFGKGLIARAGLEDVELYPKQDVLHTGPGSLVRMPLGYHILTSTRYHFITPEGDPLAPTIREQIALLAHPRCVPTEFVNQIASEIPQHPVQSPTPSFRPNTPEIVSGKPSERIKNAISVYDFVSQYVELDSKGRGHCPFHEDKHKSFAVNTRGNYWHCFAGCGGGSIIDFWMKYRDAHGEDGSFTPTITELAQMLL